MNIYLHGCRAGNRKLDLNLGGKHTRTYPHNRVQLEQGNHLDREAREFCTGTHSSCSDWSTGHHLAMLRLLENWTKIEDHVTGRNSSHAFKISFRLVGSVSIVPEPDGWPAEGNVNVATLSRTL